MTNKKHSVFHAVEDKKTKIGYKVKKKYGFNGEREGNEVLYKKPLTREKLSSVALTLFYSVFYLKLCSTLGPAVPTSLLFSTILSRLLSTHLLF